MRPTISKEAAARRIDLSMQMLEKAMNELKSVDDEVTFVYHWSAFLRQYKNIAATLISAAMGDVELRGAAHRYKNQQREDAILCYLLAARNSDEHSEEKEDETIATYGPPMINVGGAVAVRPGGAISFRNCSFDGRIVNLDINWEGDSPKITPTGLNTGVLVGVRGKSFDLHPVTDIKGRLIPVPRPTDLKRSLPDQFSEYAYAWLKSVRAELGI